MVVSVLRVHFTSADLAAVRLARSDALPVSEAVMSLQLLRRKPTATHAGWRRQVLDRLPSQAALLGALVPASGWVPDFLTPGDQGLPAAGAFDVIRATPRHRLASDLKRLSQGSRPSAWMTRLANGERALLDSLTNTLADYYKIAIMPFAPSFRALLDADRTRRAHTMTRSGVGALLAGLHPAIIWNDPVLEMPTLSGGDFHLRGRGLLLCAHVFCGPGPRALLNDTDIPVLIYPPAAGHRADAWDTAASPNDPQASAAGALLGRTRAAVLNVLSDPSGCSTKDIASRLGISSASVSEHTGVLRAAGLAVSHRRSNKVFHAATALGLQLLTRANSAP
jgi:DNA-binding transcriptional ArsR family regulator